MAVAYDATGAGSGAVTGFATSLSRTWSHTASGSDRAVVVYFYSFTSGIDLGSLTRTASYGGYSMTSLVAHQYTGGKFIEYFGLLNPPTGAQTVSISVSGGGNTGRSLVGNSQSYTGVSGFGATTTNGASTNAMSISAVSAVGRMVAQGFASEGGAFTSYSQTQRWTGTSGDGNNRRMFGGDAAGAGTVNFTANQASGGTVTWGAVTVDLLSPSVAPPTNLFYQMF